MVVPQILHARVAAALLACGLVTLAACETGPIYKPKGPGETVGYTDERLTENRFRVTFTGTRATPREEVENYLLRRAAEVTLQSGFSHFVFDTRDTEAKTYYRTDFGPWDWGPPYGPRFHPWYWSSWPMDAYTYPTTRYTAFAEIVMLTSAQAAKEPRALTAQDVLARIGGPPPPPSGS